MVEFLFWLIVGFIQGIVTCSKTLFSYTAEYDFGKLFYGRPYLLKQVKLEEMRFGWNDDNITILEIVGFSVIHSLCFIKFFTHKKTFASETINNTSPGNNEYIQNIVMTSPTTSHYLCFSNGLCLCDTCDIIVVVSMTNIAFNK